MTPRSDRVTRPRQGRRARPATAPLFLDTAAVDRARTLAAGIADEVLGFARRHTTVSTERTILRLLGLDGADGRGVPLVNVLVDDLARRREVGRGVCQVLGPLLARRGQPLARIAQDVAAGRLDWVAEGLRSGEERLAVQGRAIVAELARGAARRIRANARARREALARHPPDELPLLYAIVATGNIHEDVVQARAAALQGAQVIAVIRSTAQSLLDYVPQGATTRGFGGTYATQENMRIMRGALDETCAELGRYIRVCNYCSGLCMPEIAALGALERLDVMLNDALYGILFRDINMVRTLVDQHFSRMINGYAGIVINTGEDNYLKTADAFREAHTVLASQLVNEAFARRAGVPEEQMGLGHAFEMDPSIENGFLYEVAQALLSRQVFDRAPLKYMPPTKHMTGDIFMGHAQTVLFDLASIMTGQHIQLVGVLTEAIHTPTMHDRYIALSAARYVRNNARDLAGDVRFRRGGIVQRRAAQVLDDAVALLERIHGIGLFSALEEGVFGGVRRTRDGGKGREGVAVRADGYENPFEAIFAAGPAAPLPEPA